MIIANRRLLHEIKLILYLNSFFSSDLVSKWKFFLRLMLSERGIAWVKYRAYFCRHSAIFIILRILSWILKNSCILYFNFRALSIICFWKCLYIIFSFASYQIQYQICFFVRICIFFKEIILLFFLVFLFFHLLL